MVVNFVSISAVSNKEQLRAVASICQEENFPFPVAIGYQVSNKSVNNHTQNPRQPSFLQLGELCKETRDLGLIPAVHYYTKDNNTIPSDLEIIAETGINPKDTLLQFNTLPPTIETLRIIKEMGYKIIFKVAVSDKQSEQGGYAVWKGESVQDVKAGEVSPLIAQVQERKSLIDYVMFDPSHGTNLDLDLEENSLAVRFGKAITSQADLAHLGLVYAGGIKPNNVERIARSLNLFFPSRVSIDIESGVRTPDNHLDMRLVKEYLVNYHKTLQKHS